MTAKKKTPFAMPGVGGLKEKACVNLLHLRSWLSKRRRRFFLRLLARDYSQAVRRAYDRQDLAWLDAITFLQEAEESEGVEG